MSATNPTRDDFAALLEESFAKTDLAEGYVAKGIVTAIEKDVAIVDVGLKVEGRVPLKEFGAKAKDGTLKVGDEVEVYVERIENALGEAVLSREKARREESWQRLEVKFEAGERVEGIIFNQSRRLHRRSRRRRSLPAAFAGRHPSDPRRDAADAQPAALRNPQDGQAPRQHRRFAPHGSRRVPRRAAF